MFVLGRRAETLPGEWNLRLYVDDRLAASATFTLQLVGERKYWIDALGPTFVLKAVTARRIESGEPVDETAEFKASEPVHAFVHVGYSPVGQERAGASVGILWRWIAPSGERLERRAQTSPLTVGTSGTRAWSRLPLSESRLRDSTGDWVVEFLFGDVLLARLQFVVIP
jgi:hypothetical protein